MKLAKLALCAMLVSCTERATVTERPSDTQAALGGQVAARVDGEPIPLSLVEAVVAAQHISAKDAARKIIDDAIAANVAKKQGLETKQPTSWTLKSTRARIVADRLHEQAAKAGPPTDEEVERLSAKHWAEVDRPPTVRVMHAIARPRKKEAAADAKKVGEALLTATKDATSDADFEAKAKAVPHPKDVEIRVEKLPELTKDGRSPSGGNFDEKFSAAAYALPAPGAQSGIVETKFGSHVIRLIERLPEKRMPFEDRRAAFKDEVVAMRGSDALGALMQDLTGKTKVELSPSAAALMQSIPISTEQASNP